MAYNPDTAAGGAVGSDVRDSDELSIAPSDYTLDTATEGPRNVASSIYSADDPLAAAVRPPAGETPTERQQRLSSEAHARRVSNEIDAQLKRERKLKRKAGREVKVRRRQYDEMEWC
jgi:hypothetical protein